MSIQKFDLSSSTAIEDAAIAASSDVAASEAKTSALVSALVKICPTDRAGQEGWLAEKLPALVRGWNAKRADSGALVVAADSDSTRSARKRLVKMVKTELESSLNHDFSFVGKSKKSADGGNITVYEWQSAADAEVAADAREKAAAEKKAAKEKAANEKAANEKAEILAAAQAGTISIDDLTAPDCLRLLSRLAERASTLAIPADAVCRAIARHFPITPASAGADAMPPVPVSAESLASLLASPKMGQKKPARK